ncbi:hypothetical protein K0M31_020328 [Melipona bicolor]|uniref:Uncharacterized protein n=1 Tax=Melipona bicolor TaxID=60889 RepID=A0AA40G2B6_9HYME|nr:hypothetical protein K0M31_020328 [Melipona bicolor]
MKFNESRAINRREGESNEQLTSQVGNNHGCGESFDATDSGMLSKDNSRGRPRVTSRIDASAN